LAKLYFIGKGTSQDFSKGQYWLKKSAENGNSDAIEALLTMGIKL
jgi:TPR repeat protein